MPPFAPTDLDDPVGHGAALAPAIRAHLDDWLTALGGQGVADPPAHLRRLLATTGFRSAVEELTPDLGDEVRGVAAGAGVDADLLLALQLIDEEPPHRAGAGPLLKCSSVGLAPPEGPTWIGQTMDLDPHTRGHQVLLRVAARDGRPAALVFSIAGVVALLGVNAAGVGVCVNALPQLPAAREGLPVAFVIRRLLQAGGLDEAVALVHALPHATSQHYLLAEPGRVRSVEATPHGAAEHHPTDPARVLHTNHPLGPEPGAPGPPGAERDSRARLAALRDRLGAGAQGLAELQAAFASADDPEHPICRTRGAGPGDYTTGSMISALRPAPAPVRTWTTPGPPGTVPVVATELAPHTPPPPAPHPAAAAARP